MPNFQQQKISKYLSDLQSKVSVWHAFLTVNQHYQSTKGNSRAKQKATNPMEHEQLDITELAFPAIN